jgi:hypothetical protein
VVAAFKQGMLNRGADFMRTGGMMSAVHHEHDVDETSRRLRPPSRTCTARGWLSALLRNNLRQCLNDLTDSVDYVCSRWSKG